MTLLLCRYGEAYAGNAADQKLFRLAMQDKARHMAYGMAHLKYAIEHKGSGYGLGLKRGIIAMEYEMRHELQDPVLWEALAILCGGGLEGIEAGMAVANQVKQAYLEQCLQRLRAVGIEKPADELLAGTTGLFAVIGIRRSPMPLYEFQCEDCQGVSDIYFRTTVGHPGGALPTLRQRGDAQTDVRLYLAPVRAGQNG